MNLDALRGLAEIAVMLGTGWNIYQGLRHRNLMLEVDNKIAEVQLNLRRDMNGRYVPIERFNDLKERVVELEHS